MGLLNYSAKALFYCTNKEDFDKGDFKYRKHLDITSNEIDSSKPELMIIMMNPGSAEPIDNDIEYPIPKDPFAKYASVKIDKTIQEIIKVMEELKIKHVRIVNLSDCRQAKSDKFMELVNKGTYDNREILTTSIFHKSRNDDFEKYFIDVIPILIAWGVSNVLNKFIDLVHAKIGSTEKHYGVKNKHNKYYHPLYRKYVNRNGESVLWWRFKIIEQFKQKSCTTS